MLLLCYLKLFSIYFLYFCQKLDQFLIALEITIFFCLLYNVFTLVPFVTIDKYIITIVVCLASIINVNICVLGVIVCWLKKKINQFQIQVKPFISSLIIIKWSTLKILVKKLSRKCSLCDWKVKFKYLKKQINSSYINILLFFKVQKLMK